MKSLIGPGAWAVVARTYRFGERLVSRLFAAGVKGISMFLPDAASIRLHDRLRLVRRMDFDGADIRLVVTSDVERDSRLRSCEKEPETVQWLRANLRPGDKFFDLGANVGAYSLVAASLLQKNGMVYAVEAAYSNYCRLVENIGLNGLHDVIVPLPVALGNRTGLASFALGSAEPGSASHHGLLPPPGASSSHYVMVFRLADLLAQFALPQPNLIKLDVDGAEVAILQGAAPVLRHESLRSVLVEADEKVAPAQIQSLLVEAGFVLESEHPHTDGTTCNWIFTRAKAASTSEAG